MSLATAPPPPPRSTTPSLVKPTRPASNFVGNNNSGSGTSTTSGVGNLIRRPSGFFGTNVSNADPQLGFLVDNGGPTLTMRPAAGSPAINGGNNAAAAALTVDQTGGARFVNLTVDIGAFEQVACAGDDQGE